MKRAFCCMAVFVFALLAVARMPERATWRPSIAASTNLRDASLLSLLEPFAGGCRWSRVDPVAGSRQAIADLPAACGDVHIVASPDGATAIAWTPAMGFHDLPAAWAIGIDVEPGTIHDIALPRGASSIGFDGSGAPAVLCFQKSDSFLDRAIGSILHSRPAIDLSHLRWNGSRWDAYEESVIQGSWSQWHVTHDDDRNPAPMHDPRPLARLRASGGGHRHWAVVSDDLSVFVAIEYADASNPYSWWPTAPVVVRANDGWHVLDGADPFEGVLDLDVRGEWLLVNDRVDARLYDLRTGRMVFRSRGGAEFWLDMND